MSQPKTDEELYEILSKMPDFDRYPLPEYWYTKFNIPKPKILSMRESFALARATADAPGPNVPLEIRKPVEGGVRPLIESEPVKVECRTEVDEPKTSEDSKSQ